MLFEKRFWEPIRSGSITMTFRRWKRPQVVAGRVYRTPAGRLRVSSIEPIRVDDITDDEAIASGYRTAADLAAELRGRTGDPVYRIEFRHLDEADPRTVLANDADLSNGDIDETERRLDRLDKASSHGSWTMEYLEVIEANPERRAPDLAAMFGRETQPFKADVRKLKNLGLTLSFRVGYRLSPRGEAYLAQVRERGGDH